MTVFFFQKSVVQDQLAPLECGWNYKSYRSCWEQNTEFKIVRMITLTKEVKPGLPVAGKGVQGAEKEGRNTPHHVLLLQGLKAH